MDTNKQELHTVLGATGAMGYAVLEELEVRKHKTRAVTNTSKVEGHETVHANLLDLDATKKAIEGSTHVYLCIGLPYNRKIWKKEWPIIMQNVVDACIAHSARLIFLDNIYMYQNPLPNPFDEHSHLTKSTIKGTVRREVADIMIQAIQDGKLSGTIARSADFYGKRATNSVLYTSFLDRMLEGKNPLFITSPDHLHTYAYVHDNARAMILLGENEDCCGQVWHLPTGDPITTRELVKYYNKALGKKFKIKGMPGAMRIILSLFIPALREINEMIYQFNEDYVMNWEKFHWRFPDFKVTPYEESVKETVEWFKNN